jgi:transcriptional antiterminator NusG
LRDDTEGGEALTTTSSTVDGASQAWFALWTASHCERSVHEQLAARGFEVFLPEQRIWSTRRGVRRLVPAPLFPGYLFLRASMTKEHYIAVRQARGLVAVLGERWDRLAEIPEGEIDALQRVHEAQLPMLPHPFLREGQPVRITRGPLAGVTGTLLRADAGRGMLVLSITLLQRSVAVQVDCTSVEAASPAQVMAGAR